MDHPDLNVSNIMGNSIGTKRVKLYELVIYSQLSGVISSVIWINNVDVSVDLISWLYQKSAELDQHGFNPL